MECRYIEDRLSDYMERSLPASESERVANHLHGCRNCSLLLEEMRANLAACKAFPVLEMDVELVERILLRTSGKPRTRTFGELVRLYLIGPMLTPRFAVGASLAALFIAFSLSFLGPRITGVTAAMAPGELLRRFDRSVQGLYAEGLKLNDRKNEWQAQFSFFRNNVLNKLGFMIDELDVPQEGNKKKSGEPRQQRGKNPGEKSSELLLPTWLGRDDV
jgi:Putative zinc-finger